MRRKVKKRGQAFANLRMLLSCFRLVLYFEDSHRAICNTNERRAVQNQKKLLMNSLYPSTAVIEQKRQHRSRRDDRTVSSGQWSNLCPPPPPPASLPSPLLPLSFFSFREWKTHAEYDTYWTVERAQILVVVLFRAGTVLGLGMDPW